MTYIYLSLFLPLIVFGILLFLLRFKRKRRILYSVDSTDFKLRKAINMFITFTIIFFAGLSRILYKFYGDWAIFSFLLAGAIVFTGNEIIQKFYKKQQK